MEIIKINIGSNNVFISFDDGETLKLVKPIFKESRLKVGDEITCEQKENLININEIFLIKASALRLLGRREHSYKELKDKLVLRGFSGANVVSVLEELKELNLLNDERFTEVFVRSRFEIKKKSPKAIYYDLLKKGVDNSLILNKLEEIDEERIFSNAKELALKKIRSLQNRNEKNIVQKLRNHLTYKAYSIRIINRIIEETRKELENAEI